MRNYYLKKQIIPSVGQSQPIPDEISQEETQTTKYFEWTGDNEPYGTSANNSFATAGGGEKHSQNFPFPTANNSFATTGGSNTIIPNEPQVFRLSPTVPLPTSKPISTFPTIKLTDRI